MHYVIMTENGLGYTLGDLFTNSSGHPACEHLSPEKGLLGIMVTR
jgi:hypothetical protein